MKFDESSRHVRKFDEQNFDELIVSFIGKALTGKRLEGKTLTNRWPFVKFVTVSPFKVLRFTVSVSNHTIIMKPVSTHTVYVAKINLLIIFYDIILTEYDI